MPAARPLRVCMLAYTFYESDGRVMRYAETLAQQGASVDAIVLRKEGQSRSESMAGVRVLRIQQRLRNESGKADYLWRILKFFVKSMFEVTRHHFEQPYDVIHVHSVPDFEVFAAWLPKLWGARIILDIHDIVPEFYAAKFKVESDSIVFKALTLLERLSARFADRVIVANDLWLSKLISRSVRSKDCTVFLNYPDTLIFRSDLRTRSLDERRFVMMYPGSLNAHQGLDLAVRAFSTITSQAPEAELHIYGDGPAKNELRRLVDELGLADRVLLRPPLPLRQIAGVMADADLGVVPKRNDGFGAEAFSTKILEFMALGTPLLVAATRVDTYYFDASLLRFFEPGNSIDLAAKMLQAYNDRAESRRLAANALAHAQRVSWANKRSEYLGMLDSLVAQR
jgi:glycosyltransferase involved in cell wall biosynthesis